jgi:predicted hydrocarbon binding protein
MARSGTRAPELALPVASLAAIRRALVTEVGPDIAARALQQAGFAAGDKLYDLLASHLSPGQPDPYGARNIDDVGAATFWRRLSEMFATRGWGRLSHEQAHAGVGALESSDWVEADPDSGATRPSCFFSAGVLANVLGRAANGEVGVLEVECRSRGDVRCRFLFGGKDALAAVYDSIRTGQDADSSVAQLA